MIMHSIFIQNKIRFSSGHRINNLEARYNTLFKRMFSIVGRYGDKSFGYRSMVFKTRFADYASLPGDQYSSTISTNMYTGKHRMF